MSTSTTFAEAWVEGPKTTSFYTRTYEATAPQKAHIVFAHGFAEHVGRYEQAFPVYASKGISVFAYDQRGFGRTALDTEHKSPSSSWGVTSWRDQQEDISFFILRERERLGPQVPIVLMGHSMGGGEVLTFATTSTTPKHLEARKVIIGIVCCSPLIRQASPEPSVKVWLGDKAAILLPNKIIDAPVNANDLSHDPVANQAYLDDPLIKASGTLRGLSDMLTEGIALAEKQFKDWPQELPLLLIHGDSDKVTDHKASEKFFTDIDAKDKSISIYPGGYHELAHEPDLKARLFDEVSEWIIQHASGNEDPKL